MDRRRERYAGAPGTLWTAQNVLISRGGDIQRSYRFAPVYTLPTGLTFGLAEVAGQLWTFGSTAPGSLTIPNGVQYQQLVAPSGAAMTGVLQALPANGKLYAIAQFADGNTFHYYNGARITDWDTVADGGFTYAVLAAYLAGLINGNPAVTALGVGNTITLTAKTAGAPFTVAQSTTNFGSFADQAITLTTLQANVAAVSEVRATGSVTIVSGSTGAVTSVLLHGTTQLLYAAAAWAGTTTATAAAVATQINNATGTHGYTAVATSNVVALTAPVGQGAAVNNYGIVATGTGDIVAAGASLGGGVTAVTGVAQVVLATLSGTPESVDLFVLTVNGTNYSSTGRAAATGTSVFVSTKRVFSTAGSSIVWSALATFNDFHSNSGAPTGTGSINVADDAEGSEPLVGCGNYIGQMAVFSRRNCRIYTLSTDGTAIALAQPISNTGSLSAKAILGYGNTDLFYLDETGVRSLRARDASGAAFVNDAGTAIDPFLRPQLDTLSPAVYSRATAVVEPREGRFFLALGPYIYVLNYFPGDSINAWTYLNPGFVVSDFARVYNQLFARSGDTIYQYGGTSTTQYPLSGSELQAYVETPFYAATPPGRALLEQYDQAAQGEWQVVALVDPNNVAETVNIGTIDYINYNQDDTSLPGRTAFLALNLTGTSAGYASISSINLRDNDQEDKGGASAVDLQALLQGVQKR